MGHIIAPVKDNLVFEVLAWTPSTKGPVTAPAVNLVAPQGPVVEAPPNPNAPPGTRRGTGTQRLAHRAELRRAVGHGARMKSAIVLSRRANGGGPRRFRRPSAATMRR
jgi:hypothetical protein